MEDTVVVRVGVAALLGLVAADRGDASFALAAPVIGDRFFEDQAGCGMGMSDRLGYPVRLARSSGYLVSIQRLLVGRAGAKKSMSSWLTRSCSS